MIDPTEKSVLMKCANCQYEEMVPEWVLEELMEDKSGGYDIMCPVCNGTMYEKDK